MCEPSPISKRINQCRCRRAQLCLEYVIGLSQSLQKKGTSCTKEIRSQLSECRSRPRSFARRYTCAFVGYSFPFRLLGLEWELLERDHSYMGWGKNKNSFKENSPGLAKLCKPPWKSHFHALRGHRKAPVLDSLASKLYAWKEDVPFVKEGSRLKLYSSKHRTLSLSESPGHESELADPACARGRTNQALTLKRTRIKRLSMANDLVVVEQVSSSTTGKTFECSAA